MLIEHYTWDQLQVHAERQQNIWYFNYSCNDCINDIGETIHLKTIEIDSMNPIYLSIYCFLLIVLFLNGIVVSTLCISRLNLDWHAVFLSCNVFTTFLYQGYIGPMKQTGQYFLFFSFLEESVETVDLTVWWNPPVKFWGPKLVFYFLCLDGSGNISLTLKFSRPVRHVLFSQIHFCLT